MAAPADSASAVATAPAPAGSSSDADSQQSRVLAADANTDVGLADFPQFDPTTMGLPEGFILYSYNALKG